MKIILASGSPRRSDLLKQIGLDFEVITSDINESTYSNLSPNDIVLDLALRKAEAVFDGNLPSQDTLIIAADTIVAIDDIILGKPNDKEHAFNMLKSLSNKMHQVYTGVAMYYYLNNKLIIENFADMANVCFRNLSDEEIREYIDTNEPLDKAGAYGIQGKGAVLVDHIDGDFYTIVGLPIAKVYTSIIRNIKTK